MVARKTKSEQTAVIPPQSNQAEPAPKARGRKAPAATTKPKQTRQPAKKKAATKKPATKSTKKATQSVKKTTKEAAKARVRQVVKAIKKKKAAKKTAPKSKKPAQKKRVLKKKVKTPKIKVRIPRGIHNVLATVRKYEERIRQLPDSDFAKLHNAYISSYTIWVDKKTWTAEKTTAKKLTKEQIGSKPNFLTSTDTMDELCGHALHFNDVNSAITESLRMMVLMKVAAEKGFTVLGIVGEKQSQQQKNGPKFWKLDPPNGRSMVITYLEDGSELIDTVDNNGQTIRTLNGSQVPANPKRPQALPIMNWNKSGAKVVYVGGIQRFPYDRPLECSRFALKPEDIVRFKPVEYKTLVEEDLHFKPIPKPSDYFVAPVQNQTPIDVPAATA